MSDVIPFFERSLSKKTQTFCHCFWYDDKNNIIIKAQIDKTITKWKNKNSMTGKKKSNRMYTNILSANMSMSEYQYEWT